MVIDASKVTLFVLWMRITQFFMSLQTKICLNVILARIVTNHLQKASMAEIFPGDWTVVSRSEYKIVQMKTLIFQKYTQTFCI